MASGLFGLTLRDILKNDTAVDLAADTINCGLFTTAVTPNYTTDTAYGVGTWDGTNDVDYTSANPAGPDTLTTPAVTVSGGTLTFDADDAEWLTSTFTNAQWALIYDDTITTPTADPAVVAVDFGSGYSTTNGTFHITWNASGIFTLDYTP